MAEFYYSKTGWYITDKKGKTLCPFVIGETIKHRLKNSGNRVIEVQITGILSSGVFANSGDYCIDFARLFEENPRPLSRKDFLKQVDKFLEITKQEKGE